ncbi:hypothetical protein I6N95_25560 [Vagococcus sp. BWB3-3]|uniref:Uncharacterized protein n=1 Tax=Vagococcus allomyrinae TaxID=2794353 RepID=A0A940SYE7_9ENTE|nr:hypothetical protein [Vagococcus allomyrinae]MBP1044381.1 hypothetical protein [Vagococcus allomyrinae]
MKKGILIYGPTPIFGGQFAANKQDIVSSLFRIGNNQKLVTQVQKEIQLKRLQWQFDFDSTESDSDEIIRLDFDLVVVLPTLEKKFDAGAIQSNRMIQLTSTEYQQNDVTRIVNYMIRHS